MNNDFFKLLIKEYKYWDVYLHDNQGYLGRCVVWCKRENALDLTDATPEEQKELFEVLRLLREALAKAFQTDWFNYAFLGNEIHHLHGHFIPRYASQREFSGTIFEDKLYGQNYKTDHDFKIPEPVLMEIKTKIKECLS